MRSPAISVLLRLVVRYPLLLPVVLGGGTAGRLEAQADSPGRADGRRFSIESNLVPLEAELLDANPELIGDAGLAAVVEAGEPATSAAPELAERLAGLQTAVARAGAATDGASRLWVRVRAPSAGTLELQLENEDKGDGELGSLERPWGTRTREHGGVHWGLALYTPPDHFGQGSGRGRPAALWRAEVESRRVRLRITFRSDWGEIRQTTGSSVLLARPPVVLVHGTFSDPDEAWREASLRGPSMVASLQRTGFAAFTVDYEATNGRANDSWLEGGGGSSFEDNARVVWENPGGIRDALEHYREALSLAAARADVVGHSMGGLLLRVWASPRYNETYRRERNFGQGDIHRLVTLCTPHHGSDLPAALRFLENATLDDGPVFLAAAKASTTAALWLEGISSRTGALTDQTPGSGNLRRIGPTAVPAHALVCTVDYNQLRDERIDEARQYFSLYTYAAMAFYYNPQALDRALEALASARSRSRPDLRRVTSRDGDAVGPELGQIYDDADLFKESFRAPLEEAWEYWQSLRDQRYISSVEDHWNRGMLPVGIADIEHADYDWGFWSLLRSFSTSLFQFDLLEPDRPDLEPPVPNTLVERLRSAAFHNDWNDGVVRYDSQTGSLPQPYFTHFEDGIIHSFAPRMALVQAKVIDLLKSEDRLFRSEGFPAAGALLPYWLPDGRLESRGLTGEAAACWSGMVPAHARKYARVAGEHNVIILVRPVNPDSTPLIADHAATKGMAVKGKSSSWGPQKGFIAVSQRFSKLWRVYVGQKRQAEIAKYNRIVAENLGENPDPEGRSATCRPSGVTQPIVACRQLQVSLPDGGGPWEVHQDPDEPDAESAIRLVRRRAADSFDVCSWRTAGEDGFDRTRAPSSCGIANAAPGEPLEVLADATQTDESGQHPYLTADYDFLAFAFYLPGAPHAPPVFTEEDFRPETGFITTRQEEVLRAVNRAVQSDPEAYRAGNVAHHGPENQYPGSPYVDYPITVFEPVGPRGRMLSIRQGPAGFRDIHLKRYFARKRREGWDIYPNAAAPGWQWEHWRPYSDELGYDDRDARDLPISVLQMPLRNCEGLPAQPVSSSGGGG